MKRAHIAALLIAPPAQAASPPISLSFRDLIERPAKYNGKRVLNKARCRQRWLSSVSLGHRDTFTANTTKAKNDVLNHPLRS
jgi:hypothetical protein